MPIKFKVIEKGQPGVAGGGEKKFYASALKGEVNWFSAFKKRTFALRETIE